MNRSTSPQLFVVAAPSGAGKTSLCARLLETHADRIALSRSATTRKPRGDEQNGREYDFLSRDEFQRGIENHAFAEWAHVHGNLYGTLKSAIDENLSQHRHVLLDIDVQGARNLRAAYPQNSLLIFIAPPSFHILEFRLRQRGTESEEQVQLRLKNARRELMDTHHFDFVVVNDSFDRAYYELESSLKLRGHL